MQKRRRWCHRHEDRWRCGDTWAVHDVVTRPDRVVDRERRARRRVEAEKQQEPAHLLDLMTGLSRVVCMCTTLRSLQPARPHHLLTMAPTSFTDGLRRSAWAKDSRPNLNYPPFYYQSVNHFAESHNVGSDGALTTADKRLLELNKRLDDALSTRRRCWRSKSSAAPRRRSTTSPSTRNKHRALSCAWLVVDSLRLVRKMYLSV